MKFGSLFYLIVAVSICMLTGCTSNTFTVRTTPSGASVKIYAKGGMIHEGISDIVDFQVNEKNKKQVYGDKDKEAQLGIAIEKNGYRPIFHFLELTSDKKDPELKKFNLEALDTDIQLDVDPPGAKAIFYENKFLAKKGREGRIKIPLGEIFGGNGPSDVNAYKEFAEFFSKYNSQIMFRSESNITLPWKQSYTSATARSAFSNVRAIRIEADDHLPIIEDFSIEPGKNNTKLYQLKKMNTVLKVLSDIEGVEIEDTDAGFGYLGKTPLVRQFSYKECTRDEKFLDDNKVPLVLRAYKAGYIDQKIKVDIPWGEEITAKVSLKPRTSQITFQSDPEGVHVYVKRKKKETQYVKTDEGKSEWQEKEIYIEKHLGTTPFIYTMDASDPLEHNDSLVFKKPGYKDPDEDQEAKNRFALGINSYHKVMVPAVVKER
jgi:hypothetical protein